jgi:AcrR family transcriptional regulator
MPKTFATRADTVPLIAEVFRQHGYEGSSLSLIGRATGLGKGSLYHFFPGGKDEMASAVLAEIDAWFEGNVFAPLRLGEPASRAIGGTLDAVERYFQSGRRICLVGVIALGDARERFAGAVRGYFVRWVEALAEALVRAGHGRARATALAEEAVAALQGAIVLARALDRPGIFTEAVARQRAQLRVGRRRASRAGGSAIGDRNRRSAPIRHIMAR